MRMFQGHAWPAALLAAVVMISAPACAAQAYSVRGSYANADFERRAADDGYRHGFDDGRHDARKHQSFSPERHGEYRDAQHDAYRGGWEHREHARNFARGYEAGYREGFSRYDRERWRD